MNNDDKKLPLKGVLKKIVADLEKKGKEEEDLTRVWEKIAGTRAARNTKLAFMRSKRLVINVHNSSWLYKLTLEKETLKQKLNDALKGNKKIKELQFRIGEIDRKV